MDLFNELKKYAEVKTQTNRAKKIKSPCKVLGCNNERKPNSEFHVCKYHHLQVKTGLVIDFVPTRVNDKARYTYYYIRKMKEDIAAGRKKEHEAKDEILKDMFKMWTPLADIEKEVTSTRIQPLMDARKNDSDFWKKKSAYRARMQEERKLFNILKGVPIEFQIAEVKSDDKVLAINLMTKIDFKVEKETGFLDSKGLFIKKETLLEHFKKLFNKGEILKVLVYEPGTRSSVHYVKKKKVK